MENPTPENLAALQAAYAIAKAKVDTAILALKDAGLTFQQTDDAWFAINAPFHGAVSGLAVQMDTVRRSIFELESKMRHDGLLPVEKAGALP